MFERFTERARKVIVLAQDEARRLRHDYIGTEHLLVGLLRENGVAAQSLAAFSVTLGGVRAQVEGIVGYGEDEAFTRAPFTRRSKNVLEFSVAESLKLGHGYVGAEHLLLGLVRESESIAVRVLTNLGVEPSGIRREMLERLGVEEEDSLDRVERKIEESTDEAFSTTPIGSVRTIVRVNRRSRTLLVDPAVVDEAQSTDEPGRILDRIAAIVEGNDYRSLEEAIERSGKLLLERLPMVDVIEVSAFRERWFERRTRSGFTKTRTFRR